MLRRTANNSYRHIFGRYVTDLHTLTKPQYVELQKKNREGFLSYDSLMATLRTFELESDVPF